MITAEKNVRGLYERISAYAAKGNSLEAIEFYDELLNKPGVAEDLKVKIHNNISALYYSLGKTDLAFSYTLKSLQIQPSHKDTHTNLQTIIRSEAFTRQIKERDDELRQSLKEIHCNYLTLFTSLDRLQHKEIWPGWWVLIWQLKLPVLQIGDKEFFKVGRTEDIRNIANDNSKIYTVITRSKIHLCEDPVSAALAHAAGIPAIVLGMKRWLDSIEGERIYKITAPEDNMSNITVDEVFDTVNKIIPNITGVEKRTETSKCRNRMLMHCQGKGLDLGHGGDKICKDAIGVDHFKQSPQDIVSDVRDLSAIPDKSVDYVYSSHCLEDLEDTEGALREWLRPLKTGGHLILYLPHKDYYPNVGTPEANPGHKYDFREKDIIDLLDKIGLTEVIHTAVYPKEYSFELVAKKVI